jgi:cytoskeletal protein CcmA (bactofilin family)
VAAKWTDGKWYRGTISAVQGGKYTVDYDDGDRSVLGRSDIKIISKKPKVIKGKKVFALWEEDGTFYLGKVTEVTKTGIVITWDDGGGTASIPFGKFSMEVGNLVGKPTATGQASAGKSFILWYGGSRAGEVTSDGRIWIGGSIAGEIASDGRIWKGGSLVGEVESNGRIWEGGSIVGEVNASGKVWKDGSLVGEIEKNGRVWKGGSIVGEAPGLKIPWAAAIYFFFFFDE